MTYAQWQEQNLIQETLVQTLWKALWKQITAPAPARKVYGFGWM